VDEFGIHCRGWNLCPAKAESQRLMREYIHEMAFEFYPNADGLLIESSDYAICHCAECGPRFYEHEFAFVRELSDEMWKRNPDALVLVYPHYFHGRESPGPRRHGGASTIRQTLGVVLHAAQRALRRRAHSSGAHERLFERCDRAGHAEQRARISSRGAGARRQRICPFVGSIQLHRTRSGWRRTSG
jgi:hypothetical protein